MNLDLSPLWISLKTALSATAITFVLGVLAASWRGGRRSRWWELFDGLLLLPLVLPPTVVGFGLLSLFGRNGPLGQMLWRVGTILVFSWPATVIAAVVVAFPLMYLTARGAFEQVNPVLFDAARMLGATEREIVVGVAIPLAWPGILAGVALAFARAMGEFGATLIFAGNIPGRTETIPVAIYFAIAAGDTRSALLWSGIVLVISLGVLAAMDGWTRYQRRYLARGPHGNAWRERAAGG
jgi:molybdate transport system permease protein